MSMIGLGRLSRRGWGDGGVLVVGIASPHSE
jgi:hypothetical protein